MSQFDAVIGDILLSSPKGLINTIGDIAQRLPMASLAGGIPPPPSSPD
jgi:hypothetical protein